jgi:hypothetical protein
MHVLLTELLKPQSRSCTSQHTSHGHLHFSPTRLAAHAEPCALSLRRAELLRSALPRLPCLTLMDLSHCSAAGLDAVLRAALAPRELPKLVGGPAGGGVGGVGGAAGGEERGEAGEAAAGGVGEAAGSGAAAVGGEGGAPLALPCPLRVLRARNCARLGPGTVRGVPWRAMHVGLWGCGCAGPIAMWHGPGGRPARAWSGQLREAGGQTSVSPRAQMRRRSPPRAMTTATLVAATQLPAQLKGPRTVSGARGRMAAPATRDAPPPRAPNEPRQLYSCAATASR